MKQSNRLFLFILLNILISICTTLAVLIIWDELRGPLPKGVFADLLENWRIPQTAAPVPSPQATLPQSGSTQECIPYQAQEGDSFDSLARRYAVSAADLRARNGFTPDQALKPGNLICIPLNPQGDVVIESVIGAGDLETEHIVLENRGQGQLSLAGWRIEDGRGNIFIFPQSSELILYSGGGADIYTRSGVNNVLELYWGMDKPVWSSGAVVTLRDARGNIQATYVIP